MNRSKNLYPLPNKFIFYYVGSTGYSICAQRLCTIECSPCSNLESPWVEEYRRGTKDHSRTNSERVATGNTKKEV